MLVAEKPLKGRVRIDGRKVRDLRERRFAWTRGELAQKVALSESAVQAIETGATPSVYTRTFRKLAEAFEMTIEAARLSFGDSKEVEDWDENIEPYTRVELIEPPTFNLSVCCGWWADVTEAGELTPVEIKQIRSQRLFRIYCRGNSMERAYPDGSLIEFLQLPPGAESFEVGRDYYVQVDGRATFKRCDAVDADTVTLRALNRRIRPQKMVIRIDEIANMARAEWVLSRPK